MYKKLRIRSLTVLTALLMAFTPISITKAATTDQEVTTSDTTKTKKAKKNKAKKDKVKKDTSKQYDVEANGTSGNLQDAEEAKILAKIKKSYKKNKNKLTCTEAEYIEEILVVYLENPEDFNFKQQEKKAIKKFKKKKDTSKKQDTKKDTPKKETPKKDTSKKQDTKKDTPEKSKMEQSLEDALKYLDEQFEKGEDPNIHMAD